MQPLKWPHVGSHDQDRVLLRAYEPFPQGFAHTLDAIENSECAVLPRLFFLALVCVRPAGPRPKGITCVSLQTIHAHAKRFCPCSDCSKIALGWPRRGCPSGIRCQPVQAPLPAQGPLLHEIRLHRPCTCVYQLEQAFGQFVSGQGNRARVRGEAVEGSGALLLLLMPVLGEALTLLCAAVIRKEVRILLSCRLDSRLRR